MKLSEKVKYLAELVRRLFADMLWGEMTKEMSLAEGDAFKHWVQP